MGLSNHSTFHTSQISDVEKTCNLLDQKLVKLVEAETRHEQNSGSKCT